MRPLAAFLGLVLLAPAILTGCARRPEPENLVIIVVDALRADRLGCYGAARPTSPAIDRLAGEGVLFENAFAQCCFTPPAMGSLLTGRYVPSHGLLGWEARLPDEQTTLAEILSAAGWRTAGYVFLNLLTRNGLGQGFDEGEEMIEGIEGVTKRARAWIEKDPGKKFFLLMHCYDVHRPFLPAAPYDTLFESGYSGRVNGTNEMLDSIRAGVFTPSPEDHHRLASLYDGEIRFTDDRIDAFVRWLEEKKLLDRTIVVVTADHGEMLADRPDPVMQYTHDGSFYDPVMRIPLVVRAPGVLPRGVRVGEAVRQIDIVPSLLTLLGVEIPESVQGTPFVDGGGRIAPSGEPAFADAYPEPHRPERYLRAVRTPGRKVIHDIHAGVWEEYDLAADPAEARSVWAGPPDSLQDLLLAHAEETGEIHEICIVWRGGPGESVTGRLALAEGRILGVSQPPGVVPAPSIIAPDSKSLEFGDAAAPSGSRGAASEAGERRVLWVRVTPQNVDATLEMRAGGSAPFPIAIFGRAGGAGSVRFRLTEIGHSYLDPDPGAARGAHLFGRARLEQQRIPIPLGPEELERLRALGYVGG